MMPCEADADRHAGFRPDAVSGRIPAPGVADLTGCIDQILTGEVFQILRNRRKADPQSGNDILLGYQMIILNKVINHESVL